MRKFVFGLALIMLLGVPSGAMALDVYTTSNPYDMLDGIDGGGVSFSDAYYKSNTSGGSGTFTGGNDSIGFNSGIILTSGTAAGAVGPNNTSSYTGSGSYSTLGFDFFSDGGDLKFDYVFASEEYNEFVGSQYNDIFKLKVNGSNVAKIPGSGSSVAINSVNLNNNSNYYRNNSSGKYNIQYDGLTKVLSAEVNGLQAGINHVEFSVHDVGDSSYDSAVFIRDGSFMSYEGLPGGENPYIPAFGNASSYYSACNTFQTKDQSMWSAGNALHLELQDPLGVNIQKELIKEKEFGPVGLSSTTKLGLQAEFDPNFYMTTGHVDIDMPLDFWVKTEQQDNGEIKVTTGYNTENGKMNTYGPDAVFGLDFNYGLDLEMAVETGVGPFDVSIIDVSTPDEWSNQTKELIEEKSLFDENAEPITLLEGSKGKIEFQFPTSTINTDSNQADDYVLDENQLTEKQKKAGMLQSGGTTNAILSGELDLDACLMDLIKYVTGVPVPQKILGNMDDPWKLEKGDDYIQVGYETVSAALEAGVQLFQEFVFEPVLDFKILTSDGQQAEAKIGDEIILNGSEDGDELKFTSTVSLNQSTLKNKTGLQGYLDLALKAGILNVETQVGNQKFAETWEAFSHNYNLLTKQLALYNPDPFQLAGFNDYTFSWEAGDYIAGGYDCSSIDATSKAAAMMANPNYVEGFSSMGGWQADGTAMVVDEHLVMQTHSPTYVFSDFTFEEEAMAMSFEWFALDTIAEDILQLYFGDELLFSINGAFLGEDWMISEFIDISKFAGMTDILTIALLSPEDRSSMLYIDNINVYDSWTSLSASTITSIPTPEPSTFILLGLGLVGMIALNRKRFHKA